MNWSNKQKIYALAAVYLVGCLVLFLYGFKLLDRSNAALALAVTDQRKQLTDLQNELRNYQLGKQDIDALTQKPHHPDDFFSKDVRVVNEIKTLEALGNGTGLDFRLSVSGTAQSGAKTPNVKGEILSIPYTVTLTGPFPNVVAFLETMERLSFVTHVKTIAINSQGDDVTAVFNATFFITK